VKRVELDEIQVPSKGEIGLIRKASGGLAVLRLTAASGFSLMRFL
jgi:hypothetical protein